MRHFNAATNSEPSTPLSELKGPKALITHSPRFACVEHRPVALLSQRWLARAASSRYRIPQSGGAAAAPHNSPWRRRHCCGSAARDSASPDQGARQLHGVCGRAVRPDAVGAESGELRFNGKRHPGPTRPALAPCVLYVYSVVRCVSALNASVRPTPAGAPPDALWLAGSTCLPKASERRAASGRGELLLRKRCWVPAGAGRCRARGRAAVGCVRAGRPAAAAHEHRAAALFQCVWTGPPP